jgi:DNA-binding Lrp family transcriptional regulator
MYSKLSELDKKMLKLLLDSEGNMSTHELSQQLGIPVSTVQRRRKRLEETFLVKHYSLDPMKFGYRRVDLLIYTEGGTTIDIAKELLKREEVTSVFRTVGEHTIELLVEVFVKENLVLLDLIEQVKTMKGVRDLIWIEITETIGRNRLPRIQAPLFSSSSSQPLPESSGYQY